MTVNNMENKPKSESKKKGRHLPEIDQAALRLNQQVLWDNAINGAFKEKPATDEGKKAGIK
jgi:hypothetical protein